MRFPTCLPIAPSVMEATCTFREKKLFKFKTPIHEPLEIYDRIIESCSNTASNWYYSSVLTTQVQVWNCLLNLTLQFTKEIISRSTYLSIYLSTWNSLHNTYVLIRQACLDVYNPALQSSSLCTCIEPWVTWVGSCVSIKGLWGFLYHIHVPLTWRKMSLWLIFEYTISVRS